MSVQREKPGTNHLQLAKTFGTNPEGVVCSGGQIENFRKGWAIHIWSGKVGHYFVRSKRNIGEAESLCGHTVIVGGLFGLGNWPKCKRCRKVEQFRKKAGTL